MSPAPDRQHILGIDWLVTITACPLGYAWEVTKDAARCSRAQLLGPGTSSGYAVDLQAAREATWRAAVQMAAETWLASR